MLNPKGNYFIFAATYMPYFDASCCRYNLLVECFIVGLAFTLVATYLFSMLFLMYDLRGNISMGALIPSQYFYLPVKFFLIVLQSYLIAVLFICDVTTISLLIVCNVYNAVIISQELRLGREKYSYMTSLTLRMKSENLSHVFRSCQLIHSYIACFMGPFLLLLNASSVLISIFISVVLGMYWGKLQFFGKCCLVTILGTTLVVWTGTLDLGRILFVNGSKTLKSWRSHQWGSANKDKIMKRFLRSCKPILLYYGKTFTIGRSNVLTFQKNVEVGTFRSLMLLKKLSPIEAD